jgi:hypothetical protein
MIKDAAGSRRHMETRIAKVATYERSVRQHRVVERRRHQLTVRDMSATKVAAGELREREIKTGKRFPCPRPSMIMSTCA